MVLLDTDTVTRLHGNHPRVLEHLRAGTDPETGTTIITRIEILRGRFDAVLKAEGPEQFLRAQSLLFRTESLLGRMLIIPIDREALIHFARLTRLRGLRQIGRADLLIAGIALANGARLVTRNWKHFCLVPGLTLANWVDD